ncbi:MAG: hypothetical protein HYR75_04435, partial [Gemmatimonadetes bacterium]|nr:hypothetical protein [Gemmatimonadota bacterium]
MQTPRWPLALIALAALPAITSPAIGQRARYHGALPALDSARLMDDL